MIGRRCTCMTTTSTRCKNSCAPGRQRCSLHLRQYRVGRNLSSGAKGRRRAVRRAAHGTRQGEIIEITEMKKPRHAASSRPTLPGIPGLIALPTNATGARRRYVLNHNKARIEAALKKRKQRKTSAKTNARNDGKVGRGIDKTPTMADWPVLPGGVNSAEEFYWDLFD